MTEKYVVVTAISTFKMRYAVPISELDQINPSVDKMSMVKQMITDGSIEEFSQEHIGEVVIDTWEESEEDILTRFDKELDYASRWSKEQKLQFIKNSVDSDKKGTNYA